MADPEKSFVAEYYRSFTGYDLPLHLVNKISKEEAESGSPNTAYYIAYFDTDRRLVRVVKMLHGSISFEHKYSYYANGKLRRKEGTNASGTKAIQEFDETGKLKK